MDPKYSTNTALELEEFRRYAKAMQGPQTKNLAVAVIVFLWILYAGISNLRSGKTLLGAFMVIVVVICPLLYWYAARRQVERDYARIRADGGDKISFRFFDDHLEAQTQKGTAEFAYDKLHAVQETDTAFYLLVEKGQGMVLPKKDCSQDLAGFLRQLKA